MADTFKAVEDMTIEEKVDYALNTLNMVHRYTDEDFIEAAAIDAAYVIESLWNEICRREYDE